jgi:serine/threonine protein kinase
LAHLARNDLTDLTDSVPDSVELESIIVHERIGSGGFGTVYRASLYPLSIDLAIKFLDPSPFNSPNSNAAARFFKEADFLLKLRHKHIVPIYGVGDHQGKPFILMEYFDGKNLCDARKIGTPAPDQMLNFFECIASSLEYAHDCNVFHRDIKPSNLLTQRGGDARIIDFGVAHVLDPDGDRLTKTGATIVGGDAFAAPELIDNHRLLDARCDIYSLGACWFWLLTGTTPRGRNWESALRKVEGMTPEYESVVLKTMDQIEARYQSMTELLADIRKLRSGDSPRATDGELDDNTVTVLSVIFEQCTPTVEGFSVYSLEQRVSRVINKFTLGTALRRLSRARLIEVKEIQEPNNGYFFEAACITDAGEDWVLSNSTRVESLLPESRLPTPDDFDDDIPF